MASKSILTLDFSQVDKYIAHLKTLNYNEMNNGTKSIVNQVARDIKDTYSQLVPIRKPVDKLQAKSNPNNKGKRGPQKVKQGNKGKGVSGKYGAQKGNLRRSLRVFAKRQTDPFIVEYTVGFKTHAYGSIVGKNVIDGYYGWMVNYGEAGWVEGGKSRASKGFIQTARRKSNALISSGLSDRAVSFIQKKLAKMLGAYDASGSQFKDKAYEKALRSKYGG